MKLHNVAAALVVGALVVPAVTYAAEPGSKTDKAETAVKDSYITTKIKAEYVKDKTVSAMHVKVETDNKGMVTLSGKAKSQAEVDRAVALAKGVKGVTDVTNNIEIATN